MSQRCGTTAVLILLETGSLLCALCMHPLGAREGTFWTANTSLTVPCMESVLSENTCYVQEASSNSSSTTSISVSKHVYDDTLLHQKHSYQSTPKYIPRKVEIAGSTVPVFRQPYLMRCPLDGSPPISYHWKRYKTIDMTECANFSSDVQFMENGRSWYVDVYSEAHNGMYVCQAENEAGEEHFVDTTNFFLSTSGCSYHAPDVSVQILPIEKAHFKEGDDVNLTCTAVPVEEHEQPYWWIERNGSFEKCGTPLYSIKNYFERPACKWKTYLTIHNFSRVTAGSYFCGFGNHLTNKTLQIEDDRDERGVLFSSEKAEICTCFVSFFLVFVLSIYGKKKEDEIIPELEQTVEPPRQNFVYDAFISAHDETKQFIQNCILHPLESISSFPVPYKLCWHSRDFIPGIPILEQIADCMAESRKIIVVFSEHFMESEFCRVELDVAIRRHQTTHTRCIVPVALSSRDVPDKVKQRITYLPTVLADDTFLTNMANILGQPIQHNNANI